MGRWQDKWKRDEARAKVEQARDRVVEAACIYRLGDEGPASLIAAVDAYRAAKAELDKLERKDG